MSNERARKWIRNQALQDGDWVEADEWFASAMKVEEGKAAIILLTDAFAHDDERVLRTLSNELLDYTQRLAGLALRELAFRYEQKQHTC